MDRKWLIGGGAVVLGGFVPLLGFAMLPALLAPPGGAPGGPMNAAAVPTAYLQYVEAAGAKCAEITPPVIAAQLDAESGWSPTAVSPAGAQGIAQFMPGTWAGWGRDANGDGIANAFDPADAISVQGDYMCALAAEMKTNLATGKVSGNLFNLTLAAYNAGTGNVLRYGGVPPFAETQGYVARITRLIATTYTAAAPGPAGPPIAAGGWTAPLPQGSYRLSSRFGPRNSPGGIGSTNHRGVDLAAPGGTAIRAAHAGRVTFAGPMSGYGHLITVQATVEGHVIETRYGHMYRVGVAVGQTVAAGTVLAGVGSDGNSTGNHLHFEVRIDGAPVDPTAFLARNSGSL